MAGRAGSGRRRAVAAVVAVVLVAELVARLLHPRLPPAPAWHTPEADKKASQMAALGAAGGVDIAFVGSSVVRSGVEPDVVTAELGPGATAYNAGLTAGIPRLVEPWTLDEVLPRLHPKVLVVGLVSFDFDANPPARTGFYDAFVASPEGRHAMGRTDALDELSRWLGLHSDLWRDRAALRSPSAVLDAIRGLSAPADPDLEGIQPNGRNTYLQDQRFEDRNQSAGGLPVRDWALGTEDRDALVRLVRGAQAAGTQVVLADMPVTDEYVRKHPNGEADYQTFVAALRAVASELAVPLVELDGLRDHRYFIDEVHMGRLGAQTFTTQLLAAMRADGSLAAVTG